MTRILVVSDDGAPSGYGRISMEVNTRLVRRGYQVFAASVAYDGLLPPQLDGVQLPYWVGSLAGHPNWTEMATAIIANVQPDIVMVIQDMTYVEPMRYAPIDWSRFAFIAVSPVDGTPVWPRWVNIMKGADAGLTISQFGVEAYKQQGVSVGLCRPGVNLDRFYKLPDEKRNEIRAKLGLKSDSFLVGVFAQNQGRKSIPTMIESFFAFAVDKPHARLLLDMEATSPAGWDIRGMILEPHGFDQSKVIFREDAMRAGILDIRDRYNALDAHMVISHREGYGLPLIESQSCGIATIALDYCSGTEICGDGKGLLVKPIDHYEIGTWGGAIDRYADKKDLTAKLQFLYDNPEERAVIAKKGMEWSRAHNWDNAADSVQAAIETVVAKRQKTIALPAPIAPPPPQSEPKPDGVAPIELLENAV